MTCFHFLLLDPCSSLAPSFVRHISSLDTRCYFMSFGIFRIARHISPKNLPRPINTARIRAMSISSDLAAKLELPQSSIPIFTTVAEYRKWRTQAFEEKKSVGFVATMGALHQGHASLGAHPSTLASANSR